MRPDRDIQEDVARELRGAPDVYDQDIAVKVNEGIVTLTGFVRNHLERNTAELAAKRVSGVLALANDIEVSVASHNGRSDPAIAREALAAIRRELPLIWETVKVLVHQGHVTLEGELETDFQRKDVERAVRGVKVVTSVSNLVRLRPRPASL
ncbi:MAG: BON domain-containing protein [Steroidobacteraceae bacterium]|jgi:osmotically-inducible protein OsmY